MQRTCDICRRARAELFDRVRENGESREYAYCKACYTSLLKEGKNPSEEAKRRIARRGMECDSCGYTAERFADTFLLGCADCYDEMREIVLEKALQAQGVSLAELQNPRRFDVARSFEFAKEQKERSCNLRFFEKRKRMHRPRSLWKTTSFLHAYGLRETCAEWSFPPI